MGEELRVTNTASRDLRNGQGVKEAVKNFFLKGKNVEACGVCLNGRSSVQFEEEAVSVVFQALLAPLDKKNVQKRPKLWLCEECGTTLTELTDIFLQLEELRCQFNDLRKIIGRQVILGSLGRSKEEWLGWEEEVKRVEHIFPSLLCEEEEERILEDVKLKEMSPVVLLERLKETRNTATEFTEEQFWFEEESYVKQEAVEAENVDDEEFSFDNIYEDSSTCPEENPADEEHPESFMEVSLRLLRSRRPERRRKEETREVGEPAPRLKRRRVDSTASDLPTEPSPKSKKAVPPINARISLPACKVVATPQKSEEQIPPQHSEISCTHCDMTFDDPATFKQHQLRRHFLGSTASGDSQCPFCLKFFHDKPSLEIHQKSTHPKERQSIANRKANSKIHSPRNIFCFLCATSQRFQTPAELKTHEESPQHKQKLRSKSSAHCNVCRLNFGSDLKSLQVHFNSQEHAKEVENLAFFDTKTTFCVPCRRNFGGPRPLQSHTTSLLHKQSCKFREIESPAEVSLKCPSCPQAFEDQGSLDRHVARQHAPKGHKCKFCKRVFANRKEMLFHRRSHKDEISKNIVCDKCGKAFEHKRGLRNHIQFVHEGGPSDCEICGRTFARPPLLRYHVRYAHSGVYSSDCPHCKATFKVPHILRKHLYKVHRKETLKDNPHPCIVCFHTFPSEGDLEGHIKVHAHLKCHICGNQSPSRTHLRNHLRREHASSPEPQTASDLK